MVVVSSEFVDVAYPLSIRVTDLQKDSDEYLDMPTGF
jgi:hypothetical protein